MEGRLSRRRREAIYDPLALCNKLSSPRAGSVHTVRDSMPDKQGRSLGNGAMAFVVAAVNLPLYSLRSAPV